MVIAALVAFAILVIAWIFAPSEQSTTPSAMPAAEAVPLTA